MLEAYHQHVADRAKLGIPPLPLNAQQTAELCEILKNPSEELKGELLTLLRDRVPPELMKRPTLKRDF
ncbi:Aconitate hydratase 2 [Microcystis panniformis FACHB-1757]|uniref:Aconitate hydratase 2 n=1 Tax=Microcystis panniformis FACHB-1757 TaxID=1638788 RepID=A0A0K1S045_9CHRO|nr:Aconitate hydratase 2 [Microcystis panniformis FACHB-1757]